MGAKLPYDHFNFHLSLIKHLHDRLLDISTHNTIQHTQNDSDFDLLDALNTLSESDQFDEDFAELGQKVICHIVANQPQLTPDVPRDLFWFFGGDCLHYMPDEEISCFQQLDEARYDAESSEEPFDYQREKNRIFGIL
ncbi:PA2817 family protein [Marinibactrum halimedae]|uniref:Dehydrogenase n=1 Tax=Marinibactrum halimedae TaxID=1444977 RepID=A0AA37TAA2_9GAMM|nr:PA2817 family protein [Marinibactrum halimedae]MCD9457859.1 dehydrogenase [Marinibactrum halimedae]GLS26320.1 hypothetical protein GCM10007877_20350 [Marinibactrum halimedae]